MPFYIITADKVKKCQFAINRGYSKKNARLDNKGGHFSFKDNINLF